MPTRRTASTKRQTELGPRPWTSIGNLSGIVFGTPVLGATYTKIDIELPFTETTGVIARAFVQTRPVSTPSTVRTHLDLWPIRPTVGADITQYGSQYALYGCTFKNTANTAYEAIAHVQDANGLWVRVYLGTVTTKADAIPDASTLTPTRYVASGGSDAAAGTSAGTAWLTTQKAWSTSPDGSVTIFGPGFYGPSATGRTVAGTFRAEFPCVNSGGKNGSEINVGNQSVIEPLSVSAPTGTPAWSAAISANPYTVAPWVAVSLQGTGETLTGGSVASPAAAQWHGGAEGAPDGTLWMWDAPPGLNIDSSGIAQVGYGASREEYPKKIAFTRRDTSVCDTAGGWAEILYTNQDYNDGGAWQEATTGRLFLKLPGNARRADGQLSRNPNDYWIKAGGESIGFDVNGTGIRLSGFKMHCHAWSVQTRHAIGFTTVDHCHFSMAQNGVRWGNGTASANAQNYAAYTHDHLVEYCLFEEGNLWSQSHQAVPWRVIKSTLKTQSGADYNSGGGYSGAVTRWSALENTAVGGRGGGNRSTMRHCRTVGWFNGFSPCGSVSSEGRYAGYGSEAYGNQFENLSDDIFEFDAQGINQAGWGNTGRNALVFVSLGPTDLGPLYFFENDVYLTRAGIGLKLTEANSAAANLACVIVKHSGGSSPRLLCRLIHNTVWSDQADVWGPAEVASPTGSNEEALYLRNNLFRVTGWAVRRDSTQPYDEDFNLVVSDGFGSSTNYPLRWNGTQYLTAAGYRAASGQGTHSNIIDGVTIDPTNVAAVDALLTNPAAGNLAVSDAAQSKLVGTPIPGISDTLGRLPRMGYQP